MDGQVIRLKRIRRDASLVFLENFAEGRPMEELRTKLPQELEATGQLDAACIVRSFFRLPAGGADAIPILTRQAEA